MMRPMRMCQGWLVGALILAALVQVRQVSAMTTAELQAAIDATVGGGRVELTGDVDLTMPLNVNGSALTLASPEGTRYAITRKSATCLFSTISDASTNIRFENIEFDGNKQMGFTERIFEMTGGTVTLGAGTSFHDARSDSAGTIFVHGTGVFKMEEGSEIRDFVNPLYGAAVLVGATTSYTDGTFIMTGGLITGCESTFSTASTVYGAALYMNGGRVELSGGAITGNRATKSVGGICLYVGDLEISGTARICDNQGGKVDDLFKNRLNTKLWVLNGYRGRLTFYDETIGSALPTEGAISSVWSGHGSTQWATGLGNVSLQGQPDWILNGYYANANGYTKWGRRKVEVSSRGAMATLDEFWYLPLVDNDVVTLVTNLAWRSTYTLSGVTNVLFTSDANGPWALERGAANYTHMEVRNAKVRFENILLDGRSDLYEMTGGDLSLLSVQEDAAVTLGTNAVIQNAQSKYRAPGVRLGEKNSVFRMEAGSVIRACDCVGAGNYASAVMIPAGTGEPRPRFEMAGGVISNCTINTTGAVASGYGGVVYVYGGVFEMTGGLITGNTSTQQNSGVLHWSGKTFLSGTARIEGNTGPYPDLYVNAGQAASVQGTGDLRGHVGLSNTTIAPGGDAGVTMAADATGAWSFFPALQRGEPGYVGTVDATTGSAVKWGEACGRIDDAQVATTADAVLLCPKKLTLDEAGIATLPHVFAGVAKNVEASVTLSFEVEEMIERLFPVGSSLVLFRTDDGMPFSGALTFVLPDEAAGKLVVVSSGGVCRLKRVNGTVLIFR